MVPTIVLGSLRLSTQYRLRVRTLVLDEWENSSSRYSTSFPLSPISFPFPSVLIIHSLTSPFLPRSLFSLLLPLHFLSLSFSFLPPPPPNPPLSLVESGHYKVCAVYPDNPGPPATLRSLPFLHRACGGPWFIESKPMIFAKCSQLLTILAP